MNERDIIHAAIALLSRARNALPDLAASGAITPEQDFAAGRQIDLRIESLDARLDTLMLTGDGITPIPDHGVVEALRVAVTGLAAFNAAAEAWAAILTTVLNAADALAAVASPASVAGPGPARMAGPARVAAAPSLHPTTLALVLAGTALCAAIYAVVRSHKAATLHR